MDIASNWPFDGNYDDQPSKSRVPNERKKHLCTSMAEDLIKSKQSDLYQDTSVLQSLPTGTDLNFLP